MSQRPCDGRVAMGSNDLIEPSQLYSVGRLAEATGITPDTLRVWERRYGFPQPIRLPSGHRRYRSQDVVRLRRIAEALALGHRPGSLLTASEEELEQLLEEAVAAPVLDAVCARWMGWIHGGHGNRLRKELAAASLEMEPGHFVEERLVPLLVEIGRRWADGELEVHHEHFATQVVEDLLVHRRFDLALKREAPYRGRIVLANLSDEYHVVGLHALAWLAEMHDVEPHLLGTDTPIDEILACVQGVDAEAVGISVSLAGGGVRTDRTLKQLRQQLDDEVALVVGGAGAFPKGRRGAKGITRLRSLVEFDDWLRAFKGREPEG